MFKIDRTTVGAIERTSAVRPKVRVEQFSLETKKITKQLGFKLNHPAPSDTVSQVTSMIHCEPPWATIEAHSYEAHQL